MAGNTPSTEHDLKILIRIIKSRIGILVTVITAIITLSGGGFAVYNHFAKEYDLIRNNCIRQAIDLDIKTEIRSAQHETMINISETIIQMFENMQLDDENRANWTYEWNKVVIDNTKNLNHVLKQPRYYTPESIDACTKSETHVIQSKTIGSIIDMGNLLKSIPLRND